MAEGALKRRIEYEMKNDKLLSTHDEERSLHEAYQFLMREFEARYKVAMVGLNLHIVFVVGVTFILYKFKSYI